MWENYLQTLLVMQNKFRGFWKWLYGPFGLVNPKYKTPLAVSCLLLMWFRVFLYLLMQIRNQLEPTCLDSVIEEPLQKAFSVFTLPSIRFQRRGWLYFALSYSTLLCYSVLFCNILLPATISEDSGSSHSSLLGREWLALPWLSADSAPTESYDASYISS